MDLNKVFILKTENKNVRAVMERPSEKKELLVAEYEGFETPICDYINKRTMPETKELLAEVVIFITSAAVISIGPVAP